MTTGTENKNGSAERIAHLQMVQEVVGRMSNHCFALKALAVAIVGGVLAMVGSMQTAAPANVLYGVIPIIVVLCWMDARYFAIEKRYRAFFKTVRAGGVELFDLAAPKGKREGLHACGLMFSWSVGTLYAVMIAALLVAAVFLKGV